MASGPKPELVHRSYSDTATRLQLYPPVGEMPKSLADHAPEMRLCYGCGLPKLAREDGTVLWHLDLFSETEPCMGVEPPGGVPSRLIHCQHCKKLSRHYLCDECGEETM